MGQKVDPETQGCVFTYNSLQCQKRGGSYYDKSTKQCFCEPDKDWVKTVSGCLPKGVTCKVGETFNFQDQKCEWSKNSRTCIKLGAEFYQK